MNAVLRPAPEPTHRVMGVSDLDAVLAIEVTAYSFPWTRGNFVDSLAAGYLAWLRHDAAHRLIGYCVALPGFEETHLLNLTVAPAHQRGGHGRAMLDALADWARQRGDTALWLEVRQSNHSARALYAAAGFAEVGQRRDYYPAERQKREDAVVMRLALDSGIGAQLRGTGDALV